MMHCFGRQCSCHLQDECVMRQILEVLYIVDSRWLTPKSNGYTYTKFTIAARQSLPRSILSSTGSSIASFQCWANFIYFIYVCLLGICMVYASGQQSRYKLVKNDSMWQCSLTCAIRGETSFQKMVLSRSWIMHTVIPTFLPAPLLHVIKTKPHKQNI
jgi:hypothetical protein